MLKISRFIKPCLQKKFPKITLYLVIYLAPSFSRYLHKKRAIYNFRDSNGTTNGRNTYSEILSIYYYLSIGAIHSLKTPNLHQNYLVSK